MLLLQVSLFAAVVPIVVRGGLGKPAPRFVMPPAATASSTTPLYYSEPLPSSGTAIVHGASIAEMANGDLLAAWYGGSDEVRRDVAIFTTIRDHRTGRWSAPRVTESCASAERSLGIHVKSLGNPVLMADARGVTLFYIVVLRGGWSGGTICMRTSPDAMHWSEARHIQTSPFLNIGMLVKGAAIAYEDGTIALPIYHELLRRRAAIARVDRTGRVLDVARIEGGLSLIQPWVVTTSPRDAVAFLRWSERTPGYVTFTRTGDGGLHWSPVASTPLIQRDSALAGARLDDDSLLLIYNSSPLDRRSLSMVRSKGDGHWSPPYAIERDLAPDDQIRREYSYPFITRSRDGVYHVVYTWQRTLIRHVAFNDAWVMNEPELRSVK
ncbi:MAG TPA: sialidase family protein [Thermoanaerobaculia bacterium]|nr:sialidase family protein [Thermoanaerobaculia bacterium]